MKTDVFKWETVTSCEVAFPTVAGESTCVVSVQVGTDGAAWYVRTSDDSGGSDDGDDTPHTTESDAKATAEKLAESLGWAG